MKPGNAGGAKDPDFWCAFEDGEVKVIGDEPDNTDRIRTLQRKLYRKAKAEPAFRFYVLYDKIYREDILRHAYTVARANAGAAGVDGMTFAADRGGGPGGMAGGLARGIGLEDIPARSGAAGDDPETEAEASDRSAFRPSVIV